MDGLDALPGGDDLLRPGPGRGDFQGSAASAADEAGGRVENAVTQRLRGPRRPATSRIRHAPANAPRHPSAAAAAARPGAGRSPRTSPPEPAQSFPSRPYHSSMPETRKLWVIFRQALSGIGSGSGVQPVAQRSTKDLSPAFGIPSSLLTCSDCTGFMPIPMIRGGERITLSSTWSNPSKTTSRIASSLSR